MKLKQIKTLALTAGLAALLALGGCATTALVDGGRSAVLPDKATVQNELQGRAFTLGRVYLDITRPTDKSSHVLPDDAYVKLLRSQLETAFRNAGLDQGRQPVYTVDVAINEMRFVNGVMNWNLGVLKATAQIRSDAGKEKAGVMLRTMDGAGIIDVNPGKENMAHRFNIPAMGVAVTHFVNGLRVGKTVKDIDIRPSSWYNLNKTNNYGLHMLTPAETEQLAGIRLADYR